MQESPAKERSKLFRGLSRAWDRLSVRLAAGILILVIAPLGIGLAVLSRQHYDTTIEVQRLSANLQNRILETALRHQMMEKDRDLISSILDEIGSHPQVREAKILDHEGVVRFSSLPDSVGKRISQDSETCQACHERPAEERDRWILLADDSGEYLRSVLPIENRPSCHECHDPEKALNGILLFDTSLAGTKAALQGDATVTFAGTALVALLLVGGVGIIVRRLILVRLARLRQAARGVAGGDLDRRAPVEGRDVITTLSKDFNLMAESVSKLVSEVREREEQLASVMNSLDDGLVVLDREYRVIAANQSFCKRFKTYPESLRGRKCREACDQPPPCCLEPASCPTELCMSTGQVQRSTFRAGDGADEIVEEVYASPVFDENGEVAQVVEIWRDISERVKEEERLAEIERLVSLGTLASGFSHEVNTPLASMLTCAEAVASRIEEGVEDREAMEPMLGEIREYAHIIRSEVHRCRRITDRFLRFARGIPPSTEPIDLGEAVDAVVSLVSPTAKEAGVEVTVQRDGDLPAVTANTEVVHHVVLNLLGNAIQSFGPGGGKITIRYEVDRDVRVLIRDEGSGIRRDMREHVFEPFQTDKPQGTGLGLFLSRNFMRRFGGDVRLVESEEGVGSCFEIVFKKVEEEDGSTTSAGGG